MVQDWLAGWPSIRQMKASPYSEVPVGVNPAASMAATPVVSVGSQPTSIWPPQEAKSTATTTPVVVVQSVTGSAAARPAGRSTDEATATAAPIPPALRGQGHDGQPGARWSPGAPRVPSPGHHADRLRGPAEVGGDADDAREPRPHR